MGKGRGMKVWVWARNEFQAFDQLSEGYYEESLAESVDKWSLVAGKQQLFEVSIVPVDPFPASEGERGTGEKGGGE